MFDYGFTLFESAAVTTCTDTVVLGATIVDCGEAELQAFAVVDVTAIEIASNDELFTIAIQGSTSSTFASAIECLAILELGAKEVLNYCDTDSTTGRYSLPVYNVRNGTTYRYLRLICDVAGSISTGITFSARLQTTPG